MELGKVKRRYKTVRGNHQEPGKKPKKKKDKLLLQKITHKKSPLKLNPHSQGII